MYDSSYALSSAFFARHTSLYRRGRRRKFQPPSGALYSNSAPGAARAVVRELAPYTSTRAGERAGLLCVYM